MSLVLVAAAATTLRAQPLLERVEKLVREQVAGAAPAEPGYLGMVGDDSVDAGAGVRVLQVYPGQAADAAGLLADDLIARVGSRAIRNLDDLATALKGQAPGAKLSITVLRGGAEKRLTATLGRRTADNPAPGDPAAAQTPPVNPEPAAPPTRPVPKPPQPRPPVVDAPLILPPTPPDESAGAVADQPPVPRRRLGVRTVAVTDDVRRQNNLADARGAQVISIAAGSPAEAASVPLGAVIRSIDRRAIGSPEDLAAAIQASTADSIDISYVFRGQVQNTTARLSGPPLPPDAPPQELRARPPAVDPFAPTPAAAELPVPDETPAAAGDDRLRALEQRIDALEARIKALEAEQAKPAAGDE
jgi:hypothetical protein